MRAWLGWRFQVGAGGAFFAGVTLIAFALLQLFF
jgi:hypothetical protein